MLVCLGFACYAVEGILDFSPTLSIQPSTDAGILIGSLKPLSRIVNIVSLLGLAVFSYRRGPLHTKRWLVALVGALYSGGLLLVLLSGYFGDMFAVGIVAGVILKSFGSCFLVLWGEVMAYADNRSIAITTSCSYALCFAVAGYFGLNESVSTSVVVALMPLASTAVLLSLSDVPFGWREPSRRVSAVCREGRDGRLPLRDLPLKQLIALGIFGAAQLLVNSISEGRIDYSVEQNTVIAGAVASLFVLVLVVVSGNRFRILLLSRILIPALIIAALLVLVAEPGIQRYESYALGSCYAVFRVFVFCLWCYFGKDSGLCVSVVIAVGQSISVACNWIEQLVEPLLLRTGAVESVVLAGVIAVVLIVALFMLGENDLARKRRADAAFPESDGALASEMMETAREQLELTQRECDICLMVLRGSGTDEICGELYISQATIKTHMRNIYRKAGVHSRGELVRLLEEL